MKLWKISNSFFLWGEKNQNQKKAFFSAQNNLFNLNKVLISGLAEEKQTKKES